MISLIYRKTLYRNQSSLLGPDLRTEIGDKNVVLRLIDFQLIAAALIWHLITRLQINSRLIVVSYELITQTSTASRVSGFES